MNKSSRHLPVFNHKSSSWCERLWCEKNTHKTFSSKLKLNGCSCLLPQVQSHLENSKFHLHQTQNQQVKQYFTLGSKLSSSGGQGHGVPHPHTPGQALATVPIMRNGHVASVSDSSNPNSPVTLLTMTNHDTEVSGHENEQKKGEVRLRKTKLKLKGVKMCHADGKEIQESEPQTGHLQETNDWFFLLVL